MKYKKRTCTLCKQEFLPEKKFQKDCDGCMTYLAEKKIYDRDLINVSVEDEIVQRRFEKDDKGGKN
jgi:hypothetical protein|tara:strand:- start:246 stop:443 length:198 start_codon:yes stop_codon:yes gene_type:complete